MYIGHPPYNPTHHGHHCTLVRLPLVPAGAGSVRTVILVTRTRQYDARMSTFGYCFRHAAASVAVNCDESKCGLV